MRCWARESHIFRGLGGMSRYLKQTHGLSVLLPKAGLGCEDIVGCGESDLASDKATSKSAPAGVVFIGGFCAAGYAIIQGVVAMSSAEADYNSQGS